MLNILLIKKTHTYLNKNIKITLQNRFYPGPQRLTEIITNSKILIPRHTFSQGVLFKIPSTRTYLCPSIRYPSIQYPSIRNTDKNISTQNFLNNNTLNQILSQILQDKPFSDKPLKLLTINKKEYETNLTKNTKVNDITDEQLIIELKKRELVKEDQGNTIVKIKLQDDSNHFLGCSKNKIKLSNLGQAYFENFISNTKENENSDLVLENISKFEFIIIVPPQNASDLFIETGKQKHMLVVVDENGNFYACGYTTSKKDAKNFCDVQIKKFQENKENIQTIKENKMQKFVAFDNFIKIDKNDIRRVKWDEEYIKNLSAQTLDYLELLCEDLNKKIYKIFDKKGITKEDCLKMCIEHDNIAYKKNIEKKIGVEHPLTKNQIKKNKDNEYHQKFDNNADDQN